MIIASATALGLAAITGVAVFSHSEAAHAQQSMSTPSAPTEQRSAAPPTSKSNALTASSAEKEQVARGRYIATAADCIACHTAPKVGAPFAGGYALVTPFGKLLSSNITPDRETGIGTWTEAQFTRAVRQGKGKDNEHLYPAMPYNDYVKINDQDMHDLWAYMQTVAPVRNKVESNQLPFPFNIRLMMAGWNLFFFHDEPFKTDSKQTAEWNRGAYLVEGLEHCEACHTPKNLLGGDIGGATMQGGLLSGWYAPEVTSNAYVGVGNWSLEQLQQYLKTGGNNISVAAGPMAEAVTNSTQHLADADIKAMAVYLKSLPGSSAIKPQPMAAGDPVMSLGRHIFEANCAACHRSNGTGVTSMVPALADNPALQAADTTNLIRTVLQGNRGAMTAALPTGAEMPQFDWKLNDKQVAAVLTYTRNSWGNASAAVDADTVAEARHSLQAQAAPHAR
jgi:mono/diheme cytochrome c family protein